VIRPDFRKLGMLDGVTGNRGVVVQAGDALFSHRKQQFAVEHDARDVYGIGPSDQSLASSSVAFPAHYLSVLATRDFSR